MDGNLGFRRPNAGPPSDSDTFGSRMNAAKNLAQSAKVPHPLVKRMKTRERL